MLVTQAYGVTELVHHVSGHIVHTILFLHGWIKHHWVNLDVMPPGSVDAV